MSDILLRLNFEYFDQIKSGEKTEEFRLYDKWAKRLIGRKYDNVILTRGYPKANGIEGETRLTRPYRGYQLRSIRHPHFGPDFVNVFAIDVSLFANTTKGSE